MHIHVCTTKQSIRTIGKIRKRDRQSCRAKKTKILRTPRWSKIEVSTIDTIVEEQQGGRKQPPQIESEPQLKLEAASNKISLNTRTICTDEIRRYSEMAHPVKLICFRR